MIAFAAMAVLVGCGLSGAILRRPALPIYLGVALWVLVPTVAASAITRSSYGLHPAVLVIGTAWIANVAGGVRQARERSGPVATIAVAQIFAVGVTLLASIGTIGPSAVLGPIVNITLGPFLLFLFVSAVGKEDPSLAARLRSLLLGLASFEAVYSVWQTPIVRSGALDQILYASWYRHQDWFGSLERPLGTTDHPLVLGLLLASVIPLTASLRSGPLQILLCGLFLVGCVNAYDRAAAVVGVLATIFVIYRSNARLWARLAMCAAVPIVWALLPALPMGQRFLERMGRLAAGDDSLVARKAAYEFFAQHWTNTLMIGHGIGSSTRLRQIGVLTSSFENPLLISWYEIGGLATIAIVSGQLLLIWRGAQGPVMRGTTVAAVACFVTAVSFSSTAYSGMAAALLWCLLGMSTISQPASGTPRVQSDRASKARSLLSPAGPPSSTAQNSEVSITLRRSGQFVQSE